MSTETKKDNSKITKKEKYSKKVKDLELKKLKADKEIKRLQNKINIEQTKIELARRKIPNEYISWNESQSRAPLIKPDGFSLIKDKTLFDAIQDSLGQATFAKIFASLSKVFDCDKLHICLLEHREIGRDGRKVMVATFRYVFNQSLNKLLKTLGATFDQHVKAWNLVIDDDSRPFLEEHLSKFVKVIIDITNMTVLAGESNPSLSSEGLIAFNKLPYHVKVTKTEILNAIAIHRPKDEPYDLQISDGTKLVAFPSVDLIWTEAPFILMRYKVSSGKPRYVTYSSLGKDIEDITFQNDKSTSYAFARYMDACAHHNIQAFEQNPQPLKLESPELKKQFNGEFERFSESLATVDEVISGLSFSLLCSDYVSLLSQYHGADTQAANIVAYVCLSSSRNEYLLNIAKHFDCPSNSYPIIFSRTELEKWDEKSDNNFLFILAHELAHLLVFEKIDIYTDVFGHNISWAIYHDLLEYVFIRDYSLTNYRHYYPNDIATQDRIVDVITNIGIEEIEQIEKTRKLIKNDIHDIALKCSINLELNLKVAPVA